MEESKHAFWKDRWGNQSYDEFEKSEDFKKIFRTMQEHGLLGETIVDVGSGATSLTEYLPDPLNYKIITVDIGGENEQKKNNLHVQYDLDHIQDKGSYETRKALVKISDFLDIDPKSIEKEHVNTIIFSEILNYIDYKKVLAECAGYLKVGGRFIIFNKPNRGFKHAFFEGGVKSNTDLQNFIRSLNFEIEDIQDFHGTESHLEDPMLLIIARKL